VQGTIKSATVKQDATGQWHVTLVCHCEHEPTPATCERPVGIDVGLESFVTFDDGRKIAPPRFHRQQERKLQRLQRRLSRKRLGSRNRGKARRRVAVAAAQVRNRRNDWLHQRSTHIIRDHDTVCIEDLNLKGLVKTKRAKSFSDAGHGAFARMLEYKGRWYGCQVVQVGRFFASTKTCSVCGHRQKLELSERRWSCDICEAEHDRDINAARNLRHEGLRLLAAGHLPQAGTLRRNACGEGVRLDMSSVPR
jgi:putative transposase